ncbi:MAG: hypothetical protein PHF51_00995 [Candidatus ainarchaeum sp.]|nr:hypothetical protein [Candidatus ainarchaeum sp.]
MSPKDPAAPRYDVNAISYFDLNKDPWWAGYNRTSLDWVFSKDYKLYNTSPIPPDATLMLKPVPNRVSNVTALSFVGANATNNAISASVSITGSFEPGTHKFVPDAEAYPFRYADATNTGFKDITEVGGEGGGFGDEYELWTDPGQAKVVIGTIFIPGAGFQGPSTFSADSGSLVPMVAGSARNVKVSSHENVCCNHTFVSQDASTHVFHSQDLCILAVSGSEQQNRDALDAACKALSDVTPDKQGKCVAGSVDLNPPWTKCETNGMVTCLCEYNTTRKETRYRYPREGMAQCARCDLGSPSASLDCHTAAPCDSQGWYSQNGGSGTMTLIGLNGDGQLDSEELYLPGSQGSFVASGIQWRAIYYIRLESVGSFEGEGGFANDSIEFWSGGGGPEQLLTTLADVLENTYTASSALGKVSGAQGSQLVVHTNKSGSTARVTIMGVGADGQKVTASGVSADGGSTGVAFAEVFRVEIEGGDNEMISVTTSGGSGGGKLGVIRVEPLKFHPTTYQNASGIYLFSNLDTASLLVMDEAVLGQHNASFAFYDRFNNTFIWNQSFDFRLPTTVTLVPDTVRDAADGNKTLVCLTAKLLAKYIDEPDSISTHPLGNKTIRFYEAGAVINPVDYNEYTNDSIYVQENNDGAGGCSCDPDTGCSTSDGQIPCTSSSQCVRQSVNGITNAQPHCSYTRKCFDDSDCGEDGQCVVAVEFYGKPCNGNVDCGCEPGGDDSCTQACNLKTNTCAKKCAADSACGLSGKCSGGLCGTASNVCQDSGRCLNNFGWVGDNKTCSEDSEAGGCAVGEATFCYTVCGWGKHTAVAAFKPNMSDPIEARYGRSQDAKTYQSGGFPLDLGTLSVLLPLLLILLALAGKLLLDWQAGALRGKTAGSRK